MRIAFDARPFERERTGVGRHLEGLIGAWTLVFPGDRFLALSPRPVLVPPGLEGTVEVPYSPSGLPGTLWLQTLAPRLARRAGADLFHGSLGIVGVVGAAHGSRSIPSVATIHDLTPLLFPEWHSLKNRLGFTPFLGPSVRVARRLIAVSQATRRDLVLHHPAAEAKCRVVLNGFTPLPSQTEPVPVPSRPYVLFLGTLEPR